MGKIKMILQAYLFMLLYRIGLLSDEFTYMVNQRKYACKQCPLRRGKWCSRKQEVYISYKEGNIVKRKSVKGCGCYLPAKYFSQGKDNKALCPLNKWCC